MKRTWAGAKPRASNSFHGMFYVHLPSGGEGWVAGPPRTKYE